MAMIAKRNMDRAAILMVLSLTVVTLSHAFVSPLASQRACQRSVSLKALPEANPLLLADGLSAATRLGNSDFSSISGPLSALRTFFIVITASIFGITAIAYLTASFLVPKAAEQLERDTKRLRPGLWEEYQDKLEDGETMVNRPDLLQDLGNVMQPIIVKEYENEARGKSEAAKGDSTNADSSKVPQKEGDIIDATIVQSDDKE